MQNGEHQRSSKFHTHYCSAVRRPQTDRGGHSGTGATDISRRGFISGLAGTAALVGLKVAATPQARAAATKTVSSRAVLLPLGAPLRVKPVLTYQIEKRQELLPVLKNPQPEQPEHL